MNLYQYTPHLMTIAGLLFGFGLAFWYFWRQLIQYRSQNRRQKLAHQKLTEQFQSVSEQLHSVHNAHDRLNRSYNKLYAELDVSRNQLRKAQMENDRFLDRMAHQQAKILKLESQNQALQAQQFQQGLLATKGGLPTPKAHFAYKKTSENSYKLKRAKDDLKRVKGINLGIEATLNLAGINTWVKLSRVNAGELIDLLNQVGIKASSEYDPSTWPKQAELAAKGRWKELKRWQQRWEEQRLLKNLIK